MDNFSRNIGLITEKQQQALTAARVVVCGVGGMGGVAAEALVRMGLGNIIIVDHDVYELSNLNRQIHATEQTVGQQKVDVIAQKLRAINSNLKLVAYNGLNEQNVKFIVAQSDLIINGMDDVRASILLEREARNQRKTIVDSWITPYASVFVVTPESPHWEEFLNFPTIGKRIQDITDSDVQSCLLCEVTFTLQQFHPLKIVSPQLVADILDKKKPRPSLVPVVWLSGTLMANEAMKIITKQGRIASHWGVFYNQYDHEIRVFEGQEEKHGKTIPFPVAS